MERRQRSLDYARVASGQKAAAAQRGGAAPPRFRLRGGCFKNCAAAGTGQKVPKYVLRWVGVSTRHAWPIAVAAALLGRLKPSESPKPVKKPEI